MNIVLGVNSSEPNKVVKTISNQTSMEGILRDESSLLSPSITVQSFTDISRFNYCFIEDFKRYYYITDIVMLRSGLWLVKLRVDVLYTYSQQIKNNSAIVDKQYQNTGNAKYFNDGSYKNTVKTATEIINFSGGFNDTGELILMVIG